VKETLVKVVALAFQHDELHQRLHARFLVTPQERTGVFAQRHYRVRIAMDEQCRHARLRQNPETRDRGELRNAAYDFNKYPTTSAAA
jgi:hypothetical protein